jgi:Sec-independent protein translocase protein TatA
VGFGTDILFILALGFLFLGPKQLPAILRQIARAKAQFESASQNLKLQLDAQVDKQSHPERVNSAERTGAE